MGSLPSVSDAQASQPRRGGHQILADIRRQSRTGPQADAAERLIRYLARCQRRDGDEIRRTWRQLAKGLGLATDGLTDRQCRNRYRAAIANSLDYLIRWGYVVSRRPLYEPNGEGRCILIVLPAGVAQSVRAAASDELHRPARPRSAGQQFFSGQVGTPLGGLKGGTHSQRLIGSPAERRKAAGARARLGTRDRALARFPVRAALEAVTTANPEGGGLAFVRARPELTAVPIEVVAREAWRRAGHPDGRLSPRGDLRLQRAAAQLERVGYAGLRGPAASRAAILDLALEDWRDHWHVRRPGDKPPVTVGGLACCLSHLARRLVKNAKLRRRARG